MEAVLALHFRRSVVPSLSSFRTSPCEVPVGEWHTSGRAQTPEADNAPTLHGKSKVLCWESQAP